METAQALVGLRVPFFRLFLCTALEIMQVMHFQMHHIVRQGVLHVTVVFRATADKTAGKGVFGKTTNDLVYPARHPTTDIRESPLQQQADVRLIRSGQRHSPSSTPRIYSGQ